MTQKEQAGKAVRSSIKVIIADLMLQAENRPEIAELHETLHKNNKDRPARIRALALVRNRLLVLGSGAAPWRVTYITNRWIAAPLTGKPVVKPAAKPVHTSAPVHAEFDAAAVVRQLDPAVVGELVTVVLRRVIQLLG